MTPLRSPLKPQDHINRKNLLLQVKNEAILRLSNHPSCNCFVLSLFHMGFS